ncbi:protein of unknown function [Streptomyces sp. 2224.1]|uniref:DUF4365 domain-containing protein n=1 Tax=unclassified Streptomyces TaxID=2593676 RepID=UPI0008965969|nr:MULTISPECIES: DUF4365 domain-containing protein [unclassified Streptomyces]SEC56759.1 protein of unknown function [Streptomyces sp. 2224.1]SEF00788.1 protein of unknown function [Streptomyces sp. 2112.3]
MTKVPASRAVERAAVNEVRALLERHGHIVQEVDGGSDFGEDLYVSFVQNGRRTADLIAIQVKGGLSFRRASGYAVSTRKHADDWRGSNVPVVCVVYDPEMQALYWENATKALREAKADGTTLRSIRIDESATLSDSTVSAFARDMRRFIEVSEFREKEGFKEAQRRFTLKLEAIARKDSRPGGHPNRFFLPVALFVEEHPTAIAWVAISGLHLVGILVLFIMWPIFWEFADAYATAGPTWMWMACLYGFTVLSACLVLYEARLGRRPLILRLMSYGPILLVYYVAVASKWHWVEFGRPILESVANMTPVLIKYAIFFTVSSYAGREIVRRRRLRSAREG